MPIFQTKQEHSEPESVESESQVQRRPSSNAAVASRAAQARAVQGKGGNLGGSDVHKVAQGGVSGSGGALPHADKIQASFGTHDISSVSAHTGSEANQATKSLGAEAYATGSQIAFGNSTPDLHTAAHEAAHVIQQKAGVALKGGVGQEGDVYEQHADAVADRVVAGESAQGLLDSFAGGKTTAGPSEAIQKRDKPKKKVSGGSMKRLALAREAIAHTKSVFEFGAGNQASALKATKMNSYFRMKVMRDMSYWELAPSVRDIAMANRPALTAAMADIAKGGNCGEHATVAFDYLRVKASGQKIQKSAVEGLDHAFVLIGDLGSDTDAQITVSDPWPTNPTATLWEDHFAFTPDRSKISDYGSMVADGQNVKKVIAAGLKLNAAGQAAIKQTMSDEKTQETIDDGKGGWVWEHGPAAASGKDYEYEEEKPATTERGGG